MRRLLVLVLSLTFIAASCDMGFDLFGTSSGTKGIFKSEDNGETYITANSLLPKKDINSVSVNALVFDFTNPDILYLGASNGIFKSEDGAKNWKYILSGIAVADIVVDPLDSKVVYAAGVSEQKGKIIKSLDAGTSWVDVYTEPSTNNAVLSIAVSKNNNQIVLAGLGSGQIIKSSDAAHSWQAVKDFADRPVGVRLGPNDTAYVLTSTYGLSKSIDLGNSWTPLTDSLTQDSFSSREAGAVAVTAFDYLALDEQQSGVIYLGTEQGLFRSVNDGVNWSFLPLPLKGGSLKVSSVGVNPQNPNNLFASVASTIYKSVNGGVTWETKVLPTEAVIKQIRIHPTSENIIYLGLGNK